MYSEEPNYKREIIKQHLNNNVFEIVFGKDIKLSKLNEWISTLISVSKSFNKETFIDVDFYHESEGFSDGDEVCVLTPYFEREENDEEYNRRIKEEEKMYNKYLQTKKLEEEKYEEYLKDLEEYKRIKEKYGFN